MQFQQCTQEKVVQLSDKDKGVIFMLEEYHKSNNGISMVVIECDLTCIPLTFGMVYILSIHIKPFYSLSSLDQFFLKNEIN